MAIYQVEAVAGTQIVWAMGDPSSMICNLTSTAIDAEIEIKESISIMEVHRTLFNSWLTKCEVTDIAGGLAETQAQQTLIDNAFVQFCLYAYLKQWCFNAVNSGCCKDDCYVQQKRMLKNLSEDMICRSIPISCVKELYLAWLHGTCDTVVQKTSILSLYRTVVVNDTTHCQDHHNHHNNANYDMPPYFGGCVSCGS